MRWAFGILAFAVAVLLGLLVTQERHQAATLRRLRLDIAAQRTMNDRLEARNRSELGGRLQTERERPALTDILKTMQSRRTGSNAALHTLPVGMRAAASLTNAGQSTPQAAVETGLWASYHGDIDALTKVILLTPSGKKVAEDYFNNLPAETQAELGDADHTVALLVAYSYGVSGFELTGGDPAPATSNACNIRALVQLENGQTQRETIALQQVEGAWDVVFDSGLVQNLERAINPTSAASP